MRVLLGLTMLLLAGLAQALEVGARVAPFTLLDQYEQPYTFNDGLQQLLVARDMDGAKLVKAALEGQPKGYLEARKAVFVADISRMPALISRLFAVPAMRDYNYRVLLDREPHVASRYAVAEGAVLVLRLDNGVLRESRSFSDAEALRAALEPLAP